MTPRYRTIVDALLAAPAGRTFISFWDGPESERSISFGDFTLRAAQYAQYLRQEGLQSGQTVALVMPQGIELMAAFVGAMMLGAVPSIVAYPTFKVEPQKYRSGLLGVRTNLRASLILVDSQFPPELLLTLEGGARLVSTHATISALPPLGRQAFGANPTAFIQHSGGTTGLQKAVALNHTQVLNQLEHLSAALHLRSDDVVYSWLPLYHDMGLIACFMLPMAAHLTVVMQSPTSWVLAPRTSLELIAKHQCTLAWMPNFAFRFLARRVSANDRQRYSLSSLRLITSCAEPIDAESLDAFCLAYADAGLRPSAVSSSYAMAENVFAVTQSRVDNPGGPRRLWLDGELLRTRHVATLTSPDAPNARCAVSSGRCLEANRVRIVGDGGTHLSDGYVGEIAIASDSLFNGYLHRNETSLTGEWFLTGDLGFTYEDDLFVVGRKKDLIIVAGRNIYPHDVEDIVSSHPALHDGRCVAFGLYDPSNGTEALFAVAEVENHDTLLRPAEVTQEVTQSIQSELNVSLRQLLLKPRGWLVKSTSGKPARTATRDKVLTEHPELSRFVNP